RTSLSHRRRKPRLQSATGTMLHRPGGKLRIFFLHSFPSSANYWRFKATMREKRATEPRSQTSALTRTFFFVVWIKACAPHRTFPYRLLCKRNPCVDLFALSDLFELGKYGLDVELFAFLRARRRLELRCRACSRNLGWKQGRSDFWLDRLFL